MGRTLVHVVEELESNLVYDKDPQEMHIAMTRQDPEQRRAVQMGALTRKRIERVLTDLQIGDRRCSVPPYPDLAGDRTQPPNQLTARSDL
jgi:hypothetical protein